MRPLKAHEEAALRRIAERHGFLAQRGPHTGEGSATRLIDALITGDIVTLALTPADRRRLVEWLDTQPRPAGRLTTILGSLADQLRSTLPPSTSRTILPAPPPTSVPAARPARSTGRLTTAQAAERLGLSPGRVQELARAGEIGRKDDGRWTFSATEIARCKEERDRRDLLFSLRYPQPTPKRKRKRRTAQRRSASGRFTKADVAAMGLLDQLLAQERNLERTYALPFRAPHHTATTIHTCTRCGQDLLFLIFGDRADDAEGLAAYGRLLQEPITAHGLPAYVLGRPRGDAHSDGTPSLLRQVWPELGETQAVTPAQWDELLAQWSQAHCGASR